MYASNPSLASSQAVKGIRALQADYTAHAPSRFSLAAEPDNTRVLDVLSTIEQARPGAAAGAALRNVVVSALADASSTTTHQPAFPRRHGRSRRGSDSLPTSRKRGAPSAAATCRTGLWGLVAASPCLPPSLRALPERAGSSCPVGRLAADNPSWSESSGKHTATMRTAVRCRNEAGPTYTLIGISTYPRGVHHVGHHLRRGHA